MGAAEKAMRKRKNMNEENADESAIAGSETREKISWLNSATRHQVKATSFADPRDVAAFKRCKERGGSDKQCYRVGDNGIGFWGDDTTVGLWVALPPEVMVATWGSVAAAKHKSVVVQCQRTGEEVIAQVGDTMPHLVNITNGAGIDLSPQTCAALALSIPAEAQVVWFLPEHY